MFYLIKNSVGEHKIVEARCNTWRRWTKFVGGYSYEYDGINADSGYRFETDDIVHKAKTKKFLQGKFAELLI